MTDNALTIYQQFGQIQQAAAALYKSGYFADATSEAQAIVKVMAGAELGLPPFASMAGINIQGGKPVLGGNLIATLIKNDPRYDYKIRVMTNTECAIEFYEHGKPAGVSTFTIEDARKAKVWSKKSGGFIPLTQHNQNWESYPRNMLFNRAISNGAKWFCPGVFGGAPVYTPEEMGLETDEDGVIIEGDFATSAGKGRVLPPVMLPGEIPPAGRDDYALHITNGSPTPPKDWRVEALRAKDVSGWATAAYHLPGTANALEDAAATQRWYEHVIGAFNPQTNAAALGALDRYVSAVADGAKKSAAIEKARQVYAADTASAPAEDGSMSRRDVAPLFEDDAVGAHDSEPFGDR